MLYKKKFSYKTALIVDALFSFDYINDSLEIEPCKRYSTLCVYTCIYRSVTGINYFYAPAIKWQGGI